MLQKTYTADYLTKKKMKNNGEVQMYFIEDSHPPLISPEQFELVQELMKDGTGGKHGIFTGKVRCGDCGNTYGPKVWHSNDKYRKVIWQCNSKFKNKCRTPNITEEEMKNAFLRALNDIAPNRRHYVNKLETMIEEISDLSGLEEERRDLGQAAGNRLEDSE